MSSISVDELVGRLPKSRFQFPLSGNARDLQYVPDQEAVFVSPRLGCLESNLKESVVLVEARAAAGKSTLARYVAWATGSPLWDLSELFVGSGTVWGRLVQGFGASRFSEVLAAMAEGDFMLVIDALDEAELRASGPPFDAFLDDMRELLGASANKPKAVILGRSETIEYVKLYLGANFPARHYRIEPFEREAANQFLDNYLDCRTRSEPSSWWRSPTHRERQSVFRSARDLLYEFFILAIAPDREATWASDRVREFLGYSPVLVAISEYLYEYSDNYHRLVRELDRVGTEANVTTASQWSLLTRLIGRLLEREQQKFLKQASEVLREGLDGAALLNLYSPAEQCSLILARPNHERSATLHSALPPAVMEAYQRLLATAVPNHPFIGSNRGYANSVIRDYVHAWGLRYGSEHDRAAVRKETQVDSYLPSPLVSQFVLHLAPTDEPAAIDAADFGVLYESLLTFGEIPISVACDEDLGTTALISGDEETGPRLVVLRNAENGIQFWRRLSRARIQGASVKLGLPRGTFNLGPDLHLYCDLLEVPAQTIRVYRKGGGVVLLAQMGYIGPADGEPTVVTFGDSDFKVRWPDMRYPWVQYQSEFEHDAFSDQGDDRELRTNFNHLCRIVGWFLKVGNRARKPLFGPVTGVTVAKYGVGGTGAANRVFAYLQHEGILRRAEGNDYCFDPSPFAQREIQLTDLHLRVLKPECRDFLAGFLAWNTTARAKR